MTEPEAIDNFNFFYEGDYITREMEESKDIVLGLIEKQKKIIDEIIYIIVEDKRLLARVCNKHMNKTNDECYEQNKLCDDCIKEYFKKRVEEKQ